MLRVRVIEPRTCHHRSLPLPSTIPAGSRLDGLLQYPLPRAMPFGVQVWMDCRSILFPAPYLSGSRFGLNLTDAALLQTTSSQSQSDCWVQVGWTLAVSSSPRHSSRGPGGLSSFSLGFSAPSTVFGLAPTAWAGFLPCLNFTFGCLMSGFLTLLRIHIRFPPSLL